MKKKFSVILPIYKNEPNLPFTIPYIMNHLNLFHNYDVEVILVCDGSPDRSYEIMKEYQAIYPDTLRIVNFIKNYGQRAAVNCGMSLAKGDVIGVISADLQDPFELFSDMLKLWEQGESLVIAKREQREEKGLGTYCSNLLHSFINKNINKNYPAGGFDFYVVDKKIAKRFIEADSYNNSMQLLLLELAGNAKQVGYTREKRELGSSGWSLKKKLNQSLNIVTIYTDKPFRWFICIGAIFLFISIILSLYLIYNNLLDAISGLYVYGGIVVGFLLILLSSLGLYGFRWMQNLKPLPRYIIDEIVDEIEVMKK